VSRNSHSRAGYTISDPSQDYGHLCRALVLEISARDGPVPLYSCPRRDDDVGPRKTVVQTDGWEPWYYSYEPRSAATDRCLSGRPFSGSSSQGNSTSSVRGLLPVNRVVLPVPCGSRCKMSHRLRGCYKRR